TGRSAHDVDSETLDLGAVVAGEGGLVAAEGQAGGIPAVQAQEGVAGPVCVQEQRLVDGHVDGARTPDRVDGEMPVRLLRRPPPAGRCTPGCGLRTRRRSGSPAAIPCGPGSPPREMRRAPASTAGPTCPPAGPRDSAARC